MFYTFKHVKAKGPFFINLTFISKTDKLQKFAEMSEIVVLKQTKICT